LRAEFAILSFAAAGVPGTIQTRTCGGRAGPAARAARPPNGGASMNLLAPVMLAVLAQPGTDPQKLFLAMEEKITNATSVQITFEARVESPQDNGTAKGTVTFAPKNRVQARVDLGFASKPSRLVMVSDGTHLYASEDGKQEKLEPTPSFLGSALVTLASKTGITAGLFHDVFRGVGNQKAVNPFADLKTTHFKLGKGETIGDQTTQVVEYRMALADVTLEAAVWIDTKTTLPVKRRVVRSMGGERLVVTETYSVFQVNAKLDEKTFALPKQP
jgi:outer membrane lipoprotein-sorting protein